MTFALISGGGTGGHVYPALALADALVARGHPPARIRFVGARRGLEARVVPDAGYSIDLLPGRGIQRRFTLANVAALWENARAFVAAYGLVRRHRPRVVVGVGGYASLPCVVAARLRVRRIPVVIHEQNAAPGLANRIAVRLGAAVTVALADTPLPNATVVGNPVRPEILAVVRHPRSDRAEVAVFGGSLGARRINDAALGLYEQWRARSDVAVHHVSGTRDHHRCAARLDATRRAGDVLEYSLVPYESDMAGLYARARVAVCRAGAVTVAELAAVGLGSILVPLPGAPGDHQGANARAMAAVGGAVILPDAECRARALAALLEPLLADATASETMGAAAAGLARPDAAQTLAAFVEAAAR